VEKAVDLKERRVGGGDAEKNYATVTHMALCVTLLRCVMSGLSIHNEMLYSLCQNRYGMRASQTFSTLTRFVENTCNIYIFK